jgi:hypothetical protein
MRKPRRVPADAPTARPANIAHTSRHPPLPRNRGGRTRSPSRAEAARQQSFRSHSPAFSTTQSSLLATRPVPETSHRKVRSRAGDYRNRVGQVKEASGDERSDSRTEYSDHLALLVDACRGRRAPDPLQSSRLPRRLVPATKCSSFHTRYSRYLHSSSAGERRAAGDVGKELPHFRVGQFV